MITNVIGTFLSRILELLEKKFSDFNWNYDNNNFDVLNKSDILITDFSGIIFDYSLVFGKPVIYADTSFDKAPYDADWIEGKIWSLRAVEKIGVQLKESDFDRIKEVIDNAINSDELQKARAEIISECWEKQGESAVNTVDWLIEKRQK